MLPSREFVIDFDEAKLVFENVRKPTDEESKIESQLRKWLKIPKQDNWIGVISSERKEETNEPGKINGSSTGTTGENGESKIPTAAASVETLSASSR